MGSQCQIDYISFEACPLTAEIIAKAHRPFPEIERYSAQLQKGLPPRWPGYHKVVLDEGHLHLHLYYGVALPLLKTCTFKADVWFLDGFNPRKNDDLWNEEMLAKLGVVAVLARACDIYRGGNCTQWLREGWVSAYETRRLWQETGYAYRGHARIFT